MILKGAANFLLLLMQDVSVASVNRILSNDDGDGEHNYNVRAVLDGKQQKRGDSDGQGKQFKCGGGGGGGEGKQQK